MIVEFSNFYFQTLIILLIIVNKYYVWRSHGCPFNIGYVVISAGL